MNLDRKFWILRITLLFCAISEVSSQSCSTTIAERNITSSPSTMTSLESPGYNGGTGLYPSDMDCWWLIDSGAADLRLLLFIVYDTACNDKIYIYDGADDTASALANGLCGKSSNPVSYSTSQRFAYLRMTSDSTTEKPGFHIDHVAAKDYSETGCTSTQHITAAETYNYISSPNFPLQYSSNSNCRWALASGNNQGIEVEVILSDVEDDNPNSCDYDVYHLYDGAYKCEHNHVRKVCQEFPSVGPYNYTSNDTTITIIFVSDGSVDRRGFLIRYRTVPETITTTTTASTTTAEPTTESSTVSSTESSSSIITTESSAFPSTDTSTACHCSTQPNVAGQSTTNAAGQSTTTARNPTDITMSLEVFLGAIGAAILLMCISIATTVCITKKIQKPTQKTITPVQPFRPYEPVKKPEVHVVNMRKPPLHRKPKTITQSGHVRHIPPW